LKTAVTTNTIAAVADRFTDGVAGLRTTFRTVS